MKIITDKQFADIMEKLSTDLKSLQEFRETGLKRMAKGEEVRGGTEIVMSIASIIKDFELLPECQCTEIEELKRINKKLKKSYDDKWGECEEQRLKIKEMEKEVDNSQSELLQANEGIRILKQKLTEKRK